MAFSLSVFDMKRSWWFMHCTQNGFSSMPISLNCVSKVLDLLFSEAEKQSIVLAEDQSLLR
jgi:hypothetical protein